MKGSVLIPTTVQGPAHSILLLFAASAKLSTHNVLKVLSCRSIDAITAEEKTSQITSKAINFAIGDQACEYSFQKKRNIEEEPTGNLDL